MNLIVQLEAAREQVAACKKMCAERFEIKGHFGMIHLQALAFHSCCRLLREAEATERDVERQLREVRGAMP